MATLLNVKDLEKKNILHGISFTMEQGEMTAVMGPSGSGKSTLLYNVSGMDQADGGQVWLGGTEVVRLGEDEKAALRLNRMGFVFQQMNVLSNLNISDNIMLPAVHAGKGKKDREHLKKRALRLMEEFQIRDLAARRVTEVSGGQLQRACICRSMMLKPEILFADEPTGALNQSAAREVMQAFLKLNNAGASVLMVTHDSRVASRCERILYLLDGEIRGEMELGKFKLEEERVREQKVSEWLSGLGW